MTQSAVFFQLWTWIHAHKRQVLWGGVIVLAVGVVAGFYYWQQNAKQASANEVLSGILVRGSALVPGESSTAPLLKVAADYPGTDAAARALLLGATRLFQAGKYADAEAQFRKYLLEYRRMPFSGQALFGVAASLDAAGKTNEAITAYKDIIEHRPDENIAHQAGIALGGLYESQGQFAQARDCFVQVARAGASTLDQAREYYWNERLVRGGIGSLGSEAMARLDDLIAKHPELAPAKPAPTPLPSPPLLEMKTP